MYFGDFSSAADGEDRADQGGVIDRLITDPIAAALAAKAAGDNEVARRTAREVLRHVQKSKNHPNRPFYLTLAKAINAYCSDREDRARLLLRRIFQDQEDAKDLSVDRQNGLAQAHEELAFAVVASCQIVI
ncbi:hypothetical protein BH11CYA1_BH11CYA1_33700 [soil metagenome]